jgi:hypothetical protein
LYVAGTFARERVGREERGGREERKREEGEVTKRQEEEKKHWIRWIQTWKIDCVFGRRKRGRTRRNDIKL